MRKNYTFAHYLAFSLTIVLSGCNTLPKTQLPTAQGGIQQSFTIEGKMALRYLDQHQKTKSVTVFYDWLQKNDAYVIDLSGALGIGRTKIYGNATSAHLTNKDHKKLSASSPEALLYKVTKWHAPISNFPQWIEGKATKNSINNQYDDQKRLISSETQVSQQDKGAWLVQLSYKDQQTKPYKIKATQQPTGSNRVIMTINHVAQQ